MPISSYYKGKGEKVLRNMKKKYGEKGGESVFYATAKKRNMEPGDESMKTEEMIDLVLEGHDPSDVVDELVLGEAQWAAGGVGIKKRKKIKEADMDELHPLGFLKHLEKKKKKTFHPARLTTMQKNRQRSSYMS